MTAALLTIGQIFSTPTAQFRVKAIKPSRHPLAYHSAENIGKKAITLTVTDWAKQEYAVKLARNAYIQIDCFYKNHINPKQTSKVFSVGDPAEYGSYNLSYTGTITGITDKTVTITAHGTEVHRLKIADFCWRNWDFDMEKVKKANSEWYD
jgi:hypothetical protein